MPEVEKSKSGVTIATGFDLGARDENDLRMLGINGALLAKLKPYLGLKKNDALSFFKKKPLIISEVECRQIDQLVKAHCLTQLARRYNSSISGATTRFEDLKPEIQTIMTSVSFQHGLEMAKKTPKFWATIVAQDCDLAVKVLRNFKDNYPTRRNKEADCLERAL